MTRKHWKQPTSFSLSTEALKIIRDLAREKHMSRTALIEWLVLSYVAQAPEANKQ